MSYPISDFRRWRFHTRDAKPACGFLMEGAVVGLGLGLGVTTATAAQVAAVSAGPVGEVATVQLPLTVTIGTEGCERPAGGVAWSRSTLSDTLFAGMTWWRFMSNSLPAGLHACPDRAPGP